MIKPLFKVLAMLSLLFFAACGEKETVIEVQSVAISQPNAEMVIGETLTLKATVSPSNASYDGITWTSTNPKVASVTASGVVTAISEGNTAITVMAGRKTANCSITVVKGNVAVTSISLNKTTLEMVEGDSETITATVSPDDATDKTVTWNSSNEGIATVKDGTITAVKEGDVTITASAGGKSATCQVIVSKATIALVSINLEPKNVSLYEGESCQIEYTLVPNNATDVSLSWSSKNNSVATVTSEGKITAITEGSTSIIVSSGDISSECVVRVIKPIEATEIHLDKSNISLLVGNTYTLTATVVPDNVTDKTILWQSSNEEVATVQNGLITAKTEGSTVITASIKTIEAECVVTCVSPSTVIAFADSDLKAKLVAAFDSDGDGELSIGEAASVTSLKGVFDGVKSFVSFDEFQYFTGVKEIEASLFYGWIMNSIVLPSNLYAIRGRAFENCINLQEIYIPDSVISVEANSFVGCNKLKKVSLGSGFSHFTIHEWFGYNSKLEEIELRASCTSMKPQTFAACRYLRKVSLPDGLEIIPDSAFKGCYELSDISIPRSINYIGKNAFQDCRVLQSIEIPIGVSVIEDYTFSNCGSLIELSLPDNLTSIGKEAFSGCANLDRLTIPRSVSSIGSSAFKNCLSLTTMDIPDKVTKIPDYVFENCSSLKSISIPSSLSYIGVYAFTKCSSLETLSLPNSVTTIGGGAFSYCSNLKSLIIPEGIEALGAYFCISCTSLESVSIPVSVVKIYKNAFQDCSSLKSITIPEKVTDIGESAFKGCRSLNNVSFKGVVSYLPNEVFSGCESLSSFELSTGTTFIGSGAFYGCVNLSEINIPESVSTIQGSAFANTGLISIFIPDSVTEIEGGAFSSCKALKRAHLPQYIHYIGGSLFSGCSALEEISLPTEVINIRSYAFKDCTSLKSIDIPESITQILDEAFYNCSSLEKVILRRNNPPQGGKRMFDRTNNCPIYVPAESVNAYKSASTWQSYSYRIQAFE